MLLGGGCKKKKKPPTELASLSPTQACKHFFRRVKECANDINQIKADKLGIKASQRALFLKRLNERLKRTFSNPDLLCERYALKTRKQQTDMDKCYRERTCGAFAQCFVKMADADVGGSGMQGANTLLELRKRLKQLKSLRLRKPGAPHHGHMHAHGPRPGPHPKGMTPARPAPRPRLRPQPRPRPRPKP